MRRLTRQDVPGSRWFVALAMTGALVAGLHCGGGDTGGTGGKTTTGHGGNGGTGGTTVVVGKISSATPVGNDTVHALAFDATLSNDGSIVYFTGVGTGGPGVYSMPVASGSVTTIIEGSPFVAPFGIALSTDGKTLYVADPGAEGSALDHGRIFTVDAESGTISPIMAADDTVPRGLDVVAEGGADQIYYTGSSMGTPGIYKMPATGGSTKAIASGAPLVDPQGIAVTKNGTVYVVDAIGAPTNRGAVYMYDGTKLSEFVADVKVGFPSGLALGLDEKLLFISSLHPTKGSSSLLVVDIFSKEPSSFPIDASLDGKFEPGGIHRAHNAQRFAWVSYEPGGGSVLLVK